MDIQSVKKEYHLVRVVDDKGDVHMYKRFEHQKWIKQHNHHTYMWNELPKPIYDGKHSVDKLTNESYSGMRCFNFPKSAKPIFLFV